MHFIAQQRHRAGDWEFVWAASAGLYCVLMSEKQASSELHKGCTLSPSRGTVLVTGSLYGGSSRSAGLYWVTSEKQMSSGFTYFRTSWGTHLHQHSTQLQPVYSLGQSPSHRGSCSYECIDSPRPRGFLVLLRQLSLTLPTLARTPAQFDPIFCIR